MTTQPSKRADEQAIRRILDETAEGLHEKDVELATRHYDPRSVLFALPPPLIAPSDDPQNIQVWFDTWISPIELTYRDLQIVVDGDVAFAYGLARMVGTKVDGQKNDLWYRSTTGFRRNNGHWTIVHQHESVPFLMDGSDKAALDLKP